MTERTAGLGEFDARLSDAASTPVRVRVRAGRIVVEDADGHPVRELHVDDVREIVRDEPRVRLALYRGEPVDVECARAEALDAALLAACSTMPELTRALRTLGSSRQHTRRAAQREFFAPLLDARRRAEESVGRAAMVRAFDPDRLNRALDGYLAQLAERSADARPAARRAFAAQAEEAMAPVRAAIEEVRRTARAAAEPPVDGRLGAWRQWSGALEALFRAADHCWALLQPTVSPDPVDAG